MTSYEMRKEWFTEVLENYHTIPAVDWKRLFIDRILETSRNIAHNEQEKRYHNLIILRYIAAERLSTQKICKMRNTILPYRVCSEKQYNCISEIHSHSLFLYKSVLPISRAKISRPRLSVPKRCAADGA